VGALPVLALDSSAGAADGRVVVVEASPGDPVVERLVPELQSSGFVVRVQAHPGPDVAGQDVHDADAILRLAPDTTIDLWIVDPATHRATVVEKLDMARTRSESPGVVAVRLVEMLRARLLTPPPRVAPPQGTPAEPPRESLATPAVTASMTTPPAPTVSPPARTLASPPIDPGVSSPTTAPSAHPLHPGRVGLDAGALVLFSAGGVPPALDVLFAARWMPWSGLVVRALGALPILSPQVSASEGSATVTASMAGGSVDWRFTSEASAWRASVGAGAAAAWIGTSGSATPPNISSSGAAVAVTPLLKAQAARALGTPHVHLGIEGMLGTAFPEVGIHFAGRDVAGWGRPFGGVAVVVELDGAP
jgi:hypothetical protein